MEGERQELPVARIHARGAGQKLAQAGFAASAKAARAGRAVGRGSLVFGKVLAAIAVPALLIGLVGAGSSRYRPEPRPQIKIPTPSVRFDDTHIKALLDADYARFRYVPPPMPSFTFDRRGNIVSVPRAAAPTGPAERSDAFRPPAHEPVHRPTW